MNILRAPFIEFFAFRRIDPKDSSYWTSLTIWYVNFIGSHPDTCTYTSEAFLLVKQYSICSERSTTENTQQKPICLFFRYHASSVCESICLIVHVLERSLCELANRNPASRNRTLLLLVFGIAREVYKPLCEMSVTCNILFSSSQPDYASWLSSFSFNFLLCIYYNTQFYLCT